MRVQTLASAALAVAPSLVSATAGTLGWAIGTKKPDGSCKYTADYEADFDAIATHSGSKIVRGYAASDCNFAQQALPAAKAKGVQIVFGIWPDLPSSFDADTGALKQYVPGNEGSVYGITVGSETLYRGNFTGEVLLNKINQVKAMFPTVKVGTADSWNKYADGTADPLIQGGVEFLLVNAFGFWQGQPITNATHQYFDDLVQAYQHIQTLAGSRQIELWNGETGWPCDGGTNYGPAIAGTANAKIYYQSALCGALGWGYNAFYFEAFDELWKPASKGDNGVYSDEKHWGAMNADRTPKFNLQCQQTLYD